MLDVILREYVDPYEAKARFGSSIIDPQRDSAWVPITIYISQFQRAIVVGQDGLVNGNLIRASRAPSCSAAFDSRSHFWSQYDY